MINVADEQLLTLVEAARRLPSRRCGKRVHSATVYRWISRGIRGVRLESIRVGGSTYTSAEAIQRFAHKLSGGAAEHCQPHQSRGVSRDVECELDDAGI
jgi:hypothetical protein